MKALPLTLILVSTLCPPTAFSQYEPYIYYITSGILPFSPEASINLCVFLVVRLSEILNLKTVNLVSAALNRSAASTQSKTWNLRWDCGILLLRDLARVEGMTSELFIFTIAQRGVY